MTTTAHGLRLTRRSAPRDTRKRQLQQLATQTFDVLVVGGGVTGCGIALDAVSRGLSVALVEKRDFAAGTSSRSSKLIHGGLRYLERLDLGLVREALRERRLLIETLAPHLVHPTQFLLPLQHGIKDRAYLGAGLMLYDALAGARSAVPRHRHLSHKACLKAVPSLRGDALTGGIRYYDAQVDDARFAVTLAGTAFAQGAVCISAVEVMSFHHDGPRLTGAHLKDLERGDELDVRARVIINATGVWTTELERLAGVESPLPVRPSKGVHIVVPKDRIDSDLALILTTEKSVLFVLPWGEQWIIGTTDTDYEFGLDHPGGQPRRHRLPARSRQRRAPHAPDDGRHHRRVRGPAAARRRELRRHRRDLARAPRPAQRAGARQHRRGEVHDVPDHGSRRGGCRLPGAPVRRAAEPDRAHAPDRRLWGGAG